MVVMKRSTNFVLYAIAILSFFATCYSVIYLNKKVELYKKSMDAKQVILKEENNYLMWKYDDNESSWRNLYDLDELKGKDGVNGKDGTNGVDGKDGIDGRNGINGKDGIDGKNGLDGKDGREVEFRVVDSIIQWKYTNQSDELWNDLFDLGTLNKDNNSSNENGN